MHYHYCSLLYISDRDQIYIGDDNALTLEISAENQGEGAYEAELHVYPPQQADFTGVVRSQVTSLPLRPEHHWKSHYTTGALEL